MTDLDQDDTVCADGYPEHDEDIHYQGDDGVGWTCRRCGAKAGTRPTSRRRNP